jgi:hypothetical protein
MHRSWMSKKAFYKACVTIPHQSWLSPVGADEFAAIRFKENGYICFVYFLPS